jgi:hypothetical protein
MPESERIAYFNKLIDGIKAKEAKEELEKRRAERSKGFDTGDYSANSIFASNTVGFQDFSGGNKGGFILPIKVPFLKENLPLNKFGETAH